MATETSTVTVVATDAEGNNAGNSSTDVATTDTGTEGTSTTASTDTSTPGDVELTIAQAADSAGLAALHREDKVTIKDTSENIQANLSDLLKNVKVDIVDVTDEAALKLNIAQAGDAVGMAKLQKGDNLTIVDSTDHIQANLADLLSNNKIDAIDSISKVAIELTVAQANNAAVMEKLRYADNVAVVDTDDHIKAKLADLLSNNKIDAIDPINTAKLELTVAQAGNTAIMEKLRDADNITVVDSSEHIQTNLVRLLGNHKVDLIKSTNGDTNPIVLTVSQLTKYEGKFMNNQIQTAIEFLDEHSQDNLKGSPKDDVFVAEITNRQGVPNSLSAGDTIDGGDGDDVLILTATDAKGWSTNTDGSLKVSGFELKNVENVLFRAYEEGGVRTDLSLNQTTGLQNFVLDKATVDVKLDLVPSFGSHKSDFHFPKTFPKSDLLDVEIKGNGDHGTNLTVDYQDDVVRAHSHDNHHRADVQNLLLNNFGDAEYLPQHWTQDPLAIVEVNRNTINKLDPKEDNDGIGFHKEFISGQWDYSGNYDFGSAGVIDVDGVEIFNIRTEGRESAVMLRGDDLNKINLDLQEDLHIVDTNTADKTVTDFLTQIIGYKSMPGALVADLQYVRPGYNPNDFTIRTGAGDDSLISSGGNDKIETNNGNDTVISNGGNDNIDAGDGDNFVRAGDKNDTVATGKGHDVIDVGTGANDVTSGKGNDIITVNGLLAGNAIDGGEGEQDVLRVDGIFAANGGRSFANVDNIEVLAFTGTTNGTSHGTVVDPGVDDKTGAQVAEAFDADNGATASGVRTYTFEAGTNDDTVLINIPDNDVTINFSGNGSNATLNGGKVVDGKVGDQVLEINQKINTSNQDLTFNFDNVRNDTGWLDANGNNQIDAGEVVPDDKAVFHNGAPGQFASFGKVYTDGFKPLDARGDKDYTGLIQYDNVDGKLTGELSQDDDYSITGPAALSGLDIPEYYGEIDTRLDILRANQAETLNFNVIDADTANSNNVDNADAIDELTINSLMAHDANKLFITGNASINIGDIDRGAITDINNFYTYDPRPIESDILLKEPGKFIKYFEIVSTTTGNVLLSTDHADVLNLPNSNKNNVIGAAPDVELLPDFTNGIDSKGNQDYTVLKENLDRLPVHVSTLGGNDVIRTGDGKDLVYSGAGDDYVRVNRSSDRVYAGAGDDTVAGGSGNDLLVGGEGSDDFVFEIAGTNYHQRNYLTSKDTIFGGNEDDKTNTDSIDSVRVTSSGPGFLQWSGDVYYNMHDIDVLDLSHGLRGVPTRIPTTNAHTVSDNGFFDHQIDLNTIAYDAGITKVVTGSGNDEVYVDEGYFVPGKGDSRLTIELSGESRLLGNDPTVDARLTNGSRLINNDLVGKPATPDEIDYTEYRAIAGGEDRVEINQLEHMDGQVAAVTVSGDAGVFTADDLSNVIFGKLEGMDVPLLIHGDTIEGSGGAKDVIEIAADDQTATIAATGFKNLTIIDGNHAVGDVNDNGVPFANQYQGRTGDIGIYGEDNPRDDVTGRNGGGGDDAADANPWSENDVTVIIGGNITDADVTAHPSALDPITETIVKTQANDDVVVAAGGVLNVNAEDLRDANATFTFDGSNETDGNFYIRSGAGDDDLTGSSSSGGGDTIWGLNGDDTINPLNGSDIVIGGAGADTVNLAPGDGFDIIIVADLDSVLNGADTVVGFANTDKLAMGGTVQDVNHVLGVYSLPDKTEGNYNNDLTSGANVTTGSIGDDNDGRTPGSLDLTKQVTNYSEGSEVVANANVALQHANTAFTQLNGIFNYAYNFQWTQDNGYLFEDTNGDGLADQVVVLVGVAGNEFGAANIIDIPAA